MLKKPGCLSWKRFDLSSFILLISAAFIIGMGTAPALAAKAADAVKSAAGLIDINSATQAELEGLKGIGSSTAKKIIDNRPYKSVKDLSKAGLTEKTIESIKPFVKVGKAPAEAKSAAPAAATAAKEATKPVKETIKEAKPTAKTTAAAPAAKEVAKPVKEVKSTAKAAAAAVPGGKVNINTADKAALDALPEIGPVKAQAIIDGRPYKTIEDVMKVSGIKEKTFEKIKDMITVR